MDRVLAFTPTYDNLMRPEMAESMEKVSFDGEWDWEVSEHNPYPGRDMRNVCLQYERGRQLALAGDYDAVWFVEHDMVVPANCLQVLYGTDAPVVYSAYMLRHGTEVLSLWRKNGINSLGMSLSLYPAELQAFRRRGWGEVSGVGFGCTLIRREVLERIPIAIGEHAPDIPFSMACLRSNTLQVGRLDVACGHISNNIVLEPFMDGGVIARILANQRVTVNVDGDSVTLEKDRYYSMRLGVARELQRAGYVQITNRADEIDTTPEGQSTIAPTVKEMTAVPHVRETSDAVLNRQMAVETVTKRRPKPEPVVEPPAEKPKPKRRTRRKAKPKE